MYLPLLGLSFYDIKKLMEPIYTMINVLYQNDTSPFLFIIPQNKNKKPMPNGHWFFVALN